MEIDLNNGAYKNIKFQIIGLDAQNSAKNQKIIKVYAIIRALKK